MSLTNLRQSFLDAANNRQDTLRYAVVGWHYDDEGRWKEGEKQFPVEDWETASAKINYDYYAGFGGADCHAVIAWGDRYVYFVHEYDGATGICCVPRNAEPCAPEWADVA